MPTIARTIFFFRRAILSALCWDKRSHITNRRKVEFDGVQQKEKLASLKFPLLDDVSKSWFQGGPPPTGTKNRGSEPGAWFRPRGAG